MNVFQIIFGETKMKKIIVAYWYFDLYDSTGIKHNSSFDYSEEKRNELINLFLDCGHEIMIRKVPKILVIWVDNAGGRFRQR